MNAAAGPEDEDRLYGLMEIAERQQAAVQVALDGLAAERVALAREREALARGVRDVQIGTQGAVRSAVADSLTGAATEGVAAVQAATAPLLLRLAGMTEQAGHADAALRDLVSWASWRLLAWMMGVVASLVLFGWLASTLVLWWDTGTIGRLSCARLSCRSRWRRCRPTATSGPRRGSWPSWSGAGRSRGRACGWMKKQGRSEPQAIIGCCWDTDTIAGS